jgi:NTP pyrophosphatase (non-canonical NTP hydrolase)
MKISKLQEASGTNSRDHGFHEDWPVRQPVDYEPHEEAYYQRQLGLAITEKLALIHEEVSEALGEIRSGHDPLHVYYRHKRTGTVVAEQHYEPGDWADPKSRLVPCYKPEGFMIELADAAIRIADLAFLVGGDLEAAIKEKAEYNRTRPYKHGRKF